MTPLLCRSRGFLKLNHFKKLFFSTEAGSSKIISVDEKRGKIKKISQQEHTEAPSFLPTENFPYTYKPMSIFEEVISTYNYKVIIVMFYLGR